MKNYLFFLIFLLLFSSCENRIRDSVQDKLEEKCRFSASKLYEMIKYENERKNECLDEYIMNLNIEEKVSQLFIANLVGDTVFTPVETDLDLEHSSKSGKYLVPGGYLFFSYNLADSPEEVMYFTDSIRNYCVDHDIIPPFLAADQEGGFVNRLRTLNGPLPSCERVKDKLSVKDSYKLYKLQGIQMHSLGFDMNLAPVVEECNDENRDFLNQRSFGNSSDVELYGKSFVQAFQNVGVATVLKHFPGNTNTDPHTGLPEIKKSYEELLGELSGFKSVINVSPCAVLMSHARTEALDSDTPCCLSSNWIQDELRNNFGFNGIVFSDDIFMGALIKNGYSPEKAAVMAINAGVDCIMISEKRFASAANVLINHALEDEAFALKIDSALKRLLLYKINCGMLKFVLNDANTESYKIILCNPYDNMENRLVAFRNAYTENVNLYIEKF